MNRHLPSDLSSRTGFAGNPLDRLSEQRDDPAFIDSLKADPSTRAVVIVRDMPIMRRMHDVFMPFFTLPDAMSLGAVREVALLGRDADNIIFAVMLEDATHHLGPDYVRDATVYNVEKFFGWVSNVADFCGSIGQQPRGEE